MNKFPIFDTHCDTLIFLENGVDLESGKTEVTLPAVKEYPGWTQLFAIGIDGATMDPTVRYETLLGNYREKTTMFHRVLKKSDLKAKKPLKSILSVEGGEALCGDMSRLYSVFDDGVRAIGLTWNSPNEISDTAAKPASNSGLTPFGRDVVREMNRLGIAVDVSHLSDGGFWDVVKISNKPILASHSNGRALCGHHRNLTDAMFLALIRCGGVTGINFYPPFLGERGEISEAVDHILHFISLGGENNVGLGMDFDGTDHCLPKGVEGCGDVKLLIGALHDAGLSDSTVAKITYGNMERLFLEVLPE